MQKSNDLMLIKLEKQLKRRVGELENSCNLSYRQDCGAKWCQMGLDHSTTACPTLLPFESPHTPFCPPTRVPLLREAHYQL